MTTVELTVLPNDENVQYFYSDGLFEWFKERLVSIYAFEREIKHEDINWNYTKGDLSHFGCRINLVGTGEYIKIWDCSYKLELDYPETIALIGYQKDYNIQEIALYDIVKFYYETHGK